MSLSVSEGFPNKSLEQQKEEMRMDIVTRLKAGEDVDIDMWLYKNHTDKGVLIEAWLEANEE